MAIDWTQLRLPLMQAPMMICSSVELVIASCRAGVIGAFPCGNPRGDESLASWLAAIRAAEAESLGRGETFAPFCVNLLASSAIDQGVRAERLETCRAARVPLILTNLGDPRAEALVTAYAAVRPLEAGESRLLPALMRAAAFRFWLSRVWDVHLPRSAVMLKAHDPGHFERVLRMRREAPWHPSTQAVQRATH